MPVMRNDDPIPAQLTTSREPVKIKTAGEPGSQADTALMDAVFIIIAAWVLLFLLGFSLRRNNV